MARPVTIETEDIVAAARRLFVEQGPTVTTATIARELGISEGTIYKRFPTKVALFRAATGLPDAAFAEAWVSLVGKGDLRSHLLCIAGELVEFFREMMPRIVLRSSHPCEGHLVDAVTTAADAPPRVIVAALSGFMAGECEAGRLRCESPEVAARLLMGAIANYVFFEITGMHSPGAVGPEAYIAAVVDTLWRGLEP